VLDETARAAARRFPLRFPAYYTALANPADPEDPIRRIGWPEPEEIEGDLDAIDDPVGERGKLIHPLVIRKHRDRVILLLTSRCHFYCRFCFRAGHRREPRAGEIDQAIESIARTPGIREVILSGGDPLVLPDAALAATLQSLGRIPGLETVRIHTRAPVHDPARVTDELADTLASSATARLWLAIHASHPRELTDEFTRAVEILLDRSVPMLNQNVLLRGVNAEPETLARLFRGLYALGVRPYYLHHPDRVEGTARFRLSLAEGRLIYRRLRELVSGPAVPHYVIDMPDGSGKIPVDWLVPAGAGIWRAKLPSGRELEYRDIDADAGEPRSPPSPAP
jgi:lysine 2,3-aminomutase